MSIYELKEARQAKISALITKVGMFFAYSPEQFEANKTPLHECDKYIRLGGGAFIPDSNIEEWKEEADKINKWFREYIVTNDMKRDYISYELSNHECYYTGDIDSAISAIEIECTREEVLKVYYEEMQYQD